MIVELAKSAQPTRLEEITRLYQRYRRYRLLLPMLSGLSQYPSLSEIADKRANNNINSSGALNKRKFI